MKQLTLVLKKQEELLFSMKCSFRKVPEKVGVGVRFSSSCEKDFCFKTTFQFIKQIVIEKL